MIYDWNNIFDVWKYKTVLQTHIVHSGHTVANSVHYCETLKLMKWKILADGGQKKTQKFQFTYLINLCPKCCLLQWYSGINFQNGNELSAYIFRLWWTKSSDCYTGCLKIFKFNCKCLILIVYVFHCQMISTIRM